MPDVSANPAGETDPPAPAADSTASKTEQIQELVNALAANYQEVGQAKPGEEAKNVLAGRDLPGRDLELYRSWLAEAHRYFREASRQDVALTLASEWVLDNYYIIRQALQLIGEDLPAGYYHQLPRLTSGPLRDFPRIYAIGRGVLAYQNYLFNPIDLQAILIQLQERIPLTMGELWAVPIFLRYGLIVTLAHTLVQVIHPENPPHLPAIAPQLSLAGEAATHGHSTADDSTTSGVVANIILSLRTISEQDWNDFFESVSCTERTLREDPAAIYPRMDFKTRDLYRKEIELLSFATGRDENELAEITLDLARQNDDRQAHVGEYLQGKGRAALEEKIGYRPDLKTALKRWGRQHANSLYLTGILLITIITLLFLTVLAARMAPVANLLHLPSSNFLIEAARIAGNSPLQWIAIFLLAFLLLIPVLTIATSLANWSITLLIPPRILPKLDFKEGIPDPFQTLVVIPALITSREEIDSLVHQLELHYLRNPEPGLLFALLTDFRDADTETLPEDEDLVQHATEAIEALNARYETSKPFYFLHRKRLWNPSEGKWMGWERKRGKLHELNLLLRGQRGFIVHHPHR